jgi:hypothetical protein
MSARGGWGHDRRRDVEYAIEKAEVVARGKEKEDKAGIRSIDFLELCTKVKVPTKTKKVL